jgi:hypothetical protein
VISASAVLHVTKPAPHDSTRYEAEKAFLSGAVVATNRAGFTGTGFADYINPTGDFVEWTVNGSSAKTFSLSIRYANGGTTSRPLKIIVNGVTVNAGLAFPPTGSWLTWKTVTFKAALKAGGNNKVRAVAIGASGANLDNLVVK